MALTEYLAGEIAVDCADGVLSRREALRRLALLGFTASAAAALLASCGDDAAPTSESTPTTADRSTTSATTPPPGSTTTEVIANDPIVEEIRFAGPRGQLIGVLATAPEPMGAVLVIHENRGLTAHIRSIPSRLAADGYTALAIDLLSFDGGTASFPSEGDATAALGRVAEGDLIADLRAGLDELERHAPGAPLAVIGFCFGGGMTWQLLAAGEPRLSAAVPFYGPVSAEADFSGSLNAAVLGIYAELDSRVNASRETARTALETAGLAHEIRTFAGADHAFFNDTGARYNAEAATAAYDEMIAWFSRYLAT